MLESKETGNANLLRMRLASRTGPPDWAIEKRYIKVLDEVGYRERAISELKLCLGTQWYRAESWQMLSELLTKTGRSDAAARAHAVAQDFRRAPLELRLPTCWSSRAKRGTSRVMMRATGCVRSLAPLGMTTIFRSFRACRSLPETRQIFLRFQIADAADLSAGFD